jgi:hypothetical protein
MVQGRNDPDAQVERVWIDDKTLKFTDIYQEDLCGAGLKVRLEKVQVAWHEFQANRARDAVYAYLQYSPS